MLLVPEADAAKEINRCFTRMYLAPLWIPADEARQISQHGFNYLQIFQRLAEKAANEGKMYFLLNPKIHMMCHIMRNLEWESELSRLALNPLVWGVQMDEDAIGKSARLTRHVSAKPEFMIRRTLQRWLIKAYYAWKQAGLLK